MDDEEDACKDWWSINCCWVRKGFVKIVRAKGFLRNLLTSSRRGHSLVKWSPPQMRQGKFTFRLFLGSASRFCVLIPSYWFSYFLDLFFPFFFVLGYSKDWTALTSVETTGEEEFLGFKIVWLAGAMSWFCIFRGFFHKLCLDRTNNAIDGWFHWRSWRIWSRRRSMRDQVIQSAWVGIDQVKLLRITNSFILGNNISHGKILSNGGKKIFGKPIGE